MKNTAVETKAQSYKKVVRKNENRNEIQITDIGPMREMAKCQRCGNEDTVPSSRPSYRPAQSYNSRHLCLLCLRAREIERIRSVLEYYGITELTIQR